MADINRKNNKQDDDLNARQRQTRIMKKKPNTEESEVEEQLSALYQAHKRGVAPPHQTRRDLLQAAAKAEGQHNSLAQGFGTWVRWSKGLSSVAALGILVIVVWIGQSNSFLQKRPEAYVSAQYKTVNEHMLSSENPLASDVLRVKYDIAYREYLVGQGRIAVHHQKSATLMVSEQGWELATCENELVKVSDELLSMLAEIERIDLELVSGESVNIMYAMDGRIMSITRAKEPLRC
ncbi:MULTISPECIES: hypothetical protein [Alteromonadaceae]|uniref:Uncharacterized protein n=1 Tax=Brumicola blandensis TaxID=3075611 RepID=A0AAW8R819_9ALTE|nr:MULTISPECIES: hypothetical protein [unclassified Alteromonas]MDT0583980.1 hypothetical protein [Alteromonas sp. W409]MDT0628893.1 hypothetical protein [Alteromonas sp. W364]